MTKPNTTAQSLGQRALLALLLMVGFYTLAFGIVALLLYLPYAEWRYIDRIDFRLAIFAVVAAGAIIVAVVPRIDKFEPPGPELKSEDHPRLFELINQIASATQQTAPTHVYLVPDFNAWVAQRGGLMGFGSARVMGVGLPLLQSLTVSEFSAVLAHEFGHFHGGDTMLGPWIHKTRGAIGRTLQALADRSAWVHKIFEWYGNLFLRITHGVSRQQEFAADALAARVVGASHLATGLLSIHAFAPLFPSYFQSELAPALRAGYRPPIGTGFQLFVQSPAVASAVSSVIEHEMSQASADPFDTHPPLSERLAALEIRDHASPTIPAESAISLLNQPDSVEAQLLVHLLPADLSSDLKPTAWANVGKQVYVPEWREVIAKNRARVAGLGLEELPSLADPPGAVAVRLNFAASPHLAKPQRIDEARYIVGAALAIALHDRGYVFTASLGEAIKFDVDGEVFIPFTVLDPFTSGSMTSGWWGSFIEKTELASVWLRDAKGVA